ncbi:MAG: helix-turn-helix domain-containing protein [Lachnospiraceae bacterium]|nr:helix-turn-helix domain-containing protein [Lachnospiraceae bacterium]
MSRGKKKQQEDNLPSYHTICRASEGDPEAIQELLNHYRNYILKLSTRRLWDEYGQPYYGVDETLKNRLEMKLITVAVKFKVA